MTVACCLFACNDLPMLRSTLIHELRWVDQLCFVDMGSTDGTLEFVNSILRPGDRYEYRDSNTCPWLGFAEAHNAACALATTDWVYAGAASYCMGWGQDIKGRLERASRPVIITETHHIEPTSVGGKESMIERAALAGGMVENHVTMYRRDVGVEWRGYLHSEPYAGQVNARSLAEITTLKRYHFGGWGNNRLRACRYAWMLRRAMREPRLQEGTSRWWFDVHCKNNEAEIEQMAVEYEAMAVDKQTA